MKKDLTMKAAAEIFKLASRIGIKPRDIIGQGADIIKMGKSLFNTKVNPELTKFISDKGKIPTKILENIKIHIRSLKNASDNQIELFKINLKEIVNAKSPKPVISIKEPATSVKELPEWTKGWTPTVIKGGKDTKFNEGGIAALNAELNQLPEYYLPMAEGGRIPYGVGDWVKKKIKKKIKPYTKEGRDEFKKEWLEKKNIDMTVAEWNALSVKEKAKIWFREGNADGGIANHFRTR